MKFELESEKTIVVKQAETLTFKEIEIERVLDDIVNKKVIVWIKGFPQPVEIEYLSNERYDLPQWTNESVQYAVTEFINSLP